MSPYVGVKCYSSRKMAVNRISDAKCRLFDTFRVILIWFTWHYRCTRLIYKWYQRVINMNCETMINPVVFRMLNMIAGSF
jgi:hypothetical protein